MSKFLNDLLAPIIVKVARQTVVINGIDVVRKLLKYVSDPYTMIQRLSIKHANEGKVDTLTIDHIMRMARLILDTNFFCL